MTYRHYIAKNQKPDNIETWTEYLEKYHDIYKMMNPKMKEQHAKQEFGNRFAIQFK